MDQEKKLRSLIIQMLTEEQAHVSLDKALKGIPENTLGIKPNSLPYSIWQLAEHIRITQWDIVEFSHNENHISPNWPAEYWPESAAPENVKQWKGCLKEIKKDRDRMIKMIEDPKNQLLKPFVHGQGQTFLREAILLMDHTAYHTGEIIVVRRLLGIWK